MSPIEARTLLLVSEIERDWQGVAQALNRARSVDPKAGEAPAALVALSLDHAYQAFETMLVRVERALGLAERTGSAWHAALLFEAGVPLAGLRPALYPQAVRDDWDALMRFRHFLRHAYLVELDAERLRTNVDHLARAVAGTEPLVRALTQALVTRE